MIAKFSISTDIVPSRSRYDFWREAVSTQLTGMSLATTGVDRERFWARLSGARFPGGGLLDIDRSGCLVHRGRGEIDRAPGNALLIYRAPAVRTWFDVHGEREFVAEAGDIVVGFSDVPFSQAPVGGVDYGCRLVRLSLDLIDPPDHRRPTALPRIIRRDSGAGALFAGYLETWATQLPTLEAEAVGFAAQTLTHLAMIAFGIADPRQDRSLDAVRAGRLEAINRHIVSNLARPDLSPDRAAAAVGISVRQLHLLFEPTGTTFSRRVLALRLKRAEQLLLDGPDRPVTAVALACGFDSLATFYRAFKAETGMTASEFREAARGAPGSGPGGAPA